jgi:hypothetical protein
MRKIYVILSLMLIGTFFFSACAPAIYAEANDPLADKTVPESIKIDTAPVLSPVEPTAPTPTPVPVEEPTKVTEQLGPDLEDFPQGINPLTGLPASDPSFLDIPAVLVSITNFPASARPQAGLSFSPFVFEIYISEGMTRFLTVFYGEYPKAGDQGTGNGDQSPAPEIGPIRSGRLPYVYIRDFFQNSCLVYASATEELRAKLRGCAIVYGSDANNINSALLNVTRMQEIAAQSDNGNPFNYTGNLFDPSPLTSGQTAEKLNIFYSYKNQAQWQYDPSAATYLRFEDKADGSGKFYPATDRLTGEQLHFENVIVLIAPHKAVKPTIIDIQLGIGNMGKAYLFRDGQMTPIYWSTVSGDYEKETGLRRPIHFVDADGNPIALKPGHTWVHVMTPASYVEEKEPGMWLARFYAPAGSK